MTTARDELVEKIGEIMFTRPVTASATAHLRVADFIRENYVEKKSAQFDTSMWESLAAEIAVTLWQFPCHHVDAHGDKGTTPPMMFPEWILCIISKQQDDFKERETALVEQVDVLRGSLLAIVAILDRAEDGMDAFEAMDAIENEARRAVEEK